MRRKLETLAIAAGVAAAVFTVKSQLEKMPTKTEPVAIQQLVPLGLEPAASAPAVLAPVASAPAELAVPAGGAASVLSTIFSDSFGGGGLAAWSASQPPVPVTVPPVDTVSIREDPLVAPWVGVTIHFMLRRMPLSVELLQRQPLAQGAHVETLDGIRYRVSVIDPLNYGTWANVIQQDSRQGGCPCLFRVTEASRVWLAGYRRPSDPPLPVGYADLSTW